MPEPRTDLAHAASAVTGQSRERALVLTAAIRVIAVTAFLGIGIVWTSTREMSPWILTWPLAAYLALAVLALAYRRRALTMRLSWGLPFLDIGVAFLVHQLGISADRGTPRALAAWGVTGLGAYTLIVALAGLSVPARWVVVLTLLSTVAEVAILQLAGLSYWPMAMAVFALAFVAVATSAVPRNAEAALSRGQQATTAMISLAKLQEQHQHLELLQRERDALLEIIIHDMRSPVGAALLSLEYLAIELKKRPGLAPLLEATDDALGTMNSLSGMITQILDMSKLESGRLTLRLDFAELRPILEAAVREAAPRARARSTRMEFDAPEGLTAAVDLRLFPRILEVLTTHSLRHTPEGGRILLVASASAEEIRVSIHSTAPAIPNPQRQRMFDKFPPANAETKRSSAWGVGLYFCRLVASAHQGTIALEKIDGWSTSFVIHLPAHSKPA
jgi:two-component system heavy metal sensor histidine kinase CusS